MCIRDSAIAIFFAMRVWKRGRALLAQYFTKAATPLESFLEDLGMSTFECADGKLPIVRTPGVAVFLTSSPTGTPPLLMHHVRHNLALHATVMLVTVTTESVPRVTGDRFTLEELEHGFYRVGIRVGFMETPDVPRAVSYTHLRAHETVLDLVCRLLLAKNNNCNSA